MFLRMVVWCGLLVQHEYIVEILQGLCVMMDSRFISLHHNLSQVRETLLLRQFEGCEISLHLFGGITEERVLVGLVETLIPLY